MSVSLDAPAREIRRAIAKIERRLAVERDPEAARLDSELRDIYRVVLFRRGLKI